MKEAEQRIGSLWFTPQVRKVFMDSCGYFAMNSEQEEQEVFMRRIFEGKLFPRFHLIVESEEVDYKFNLHFDVRAHVSDHFRDDIPIELERINNRLEGLTSLSLSEPGVDRLKREFMALMMYGAYEGMSRPQFSLNTNFLYGNKKDVRRKRRSGRPNLIFDPNEYYE